MMKMICPRCGKEIKVEWNGLKPVPQALPVNNRKTGKVEWICIECYNRRIDHFRRLKLLFS